MEKWRNVTLRIRFALWSNRSTTITGYQFMPEFFVFSVSGIDSINYSDFYLARKFALQWDTREGILNFSRFTNHFNVIAF
jgi:hypothetical protein